MKTFKVIKSSAWSTTSLTEKVETILSEKTREGWDIVSVSFGINPWAMPSAFITIRKT